MASDGYDVARWERAGFTDEHPQAPGWRVRFVHDPAAWTALDQADWRDVQARQRGWAEGIRAEFPAGAPVRADIRTWMPWRDETDYGFLVRSNEPSRVRAVLRQATGRMACVDEFGAEWPEYTLTDEVYTPNFIFGPKLVDGLLEIGVDSKGVGYDLMWRAMLCIARDELVRAGLSGVTFLPRPNSAPGVRRPQDLGDWLLRPGDVGYAAPVQAAGSPLDEAIARILRQAEAGTPPARDLSRRIEGLALAEGVHPDVALDRVITALAGRHEQTLMLAPEPFWTEHTAALARVLESHDGLARAMLSGVAPGIGPDTWLELLDGVGLGERVPLLDDERLGTFLRALLNALPSAVVPRRQPRLLRLLDEVGDRLPALGELPARSPDAILDLDIADVLLAHRAALPPEEPIPDNLVTWWLLDESAGRRDLAAVAAHPGLGPQVLTQLLNELDNRLDQPDGDHCGVDSAWFLGQAAESPGLKTLLLDWLDAQLRTLPDAHLAQGRLILERLAVWRCPGGDAIAGERMRALRGFDPAAALARTVRAGILAELCWPAFEQTLERLFGDRASAYAVPGVGLHDAWPGLILRAGDRVVLVGPDLAGEERQAPGADPRQFFEAGGDVLVTWRDGDNPVGRWVGSGAAVTLEHGAQLTAAVSVPLGDGGRLYDRVALRPGVETWPQAANLVIGDGERCWLPESSEHWSDPVRSYREVEPDTGALGPPSFPPWVERARDGATVLYLDSRPGRPWLTETWLNTGRPGPVGAVVGIAVIAGPDGERLVTPCGVDLAVPAGLDTHPKALLNFPGAPAVLVTDTGLFTADGQPTAWWESETAFRGGGPLPPLPYWYCLRPRDEAASGRLRSIDAAQAGELCRAAADPGADLPAVAVRVLGPMPRRLARGLAELARFAVGLGTRAAELATMPVVPTGRFPVSAALTDARITAALADFTVSGHGTGFIHGFRQMAAGRRLATAVLDGAPRQRYGLDPDAEWARLINYPGFALVRAMSVTTGRQQRETLCALVVVLADSGLLTGDIGVQMARSWPDSEIVRGSGIAPDRPDAGTLREVAVELARREPSIDPADIESVCRATGLTSGEAALLLAGMPSPRATWPRPEFDPEVCARLAITPVAAAVAWERLIRLDKSALMQVVAAGAPRDPGRPQVDAGAMAGAYVRRFGWRVSVPEDLVALLADTGPQPVFGGGPAAWEQLGAWAATPPGSATLFVPNDPDAVDSPLSWELAAGLMLWANYRIPASHPWRARLPGMLRQLRASLVDPRAIIDLGMVGQDQLAYAGITDLPIVRQTPDDAAVYLFEANGLTMPLLRVRPARLSESRIAQLTALSDCGVRGFEGLRWLVASQQADVLGSDLAHEPGTGELHDPAVSAPDVVANVIDELGTDPDAARYLLQLFALPDPTDENVCRWNGWSDKRFNAAADAVAALTVDGAPVVVRDVRDRAGRTLFLPGGWDDHLGEPNLPVEEWKCSAYRIGRSVPDAEMAGLLVPVYSHGRLFASAWSSWRRNRPS